MSQVEFIQLGTNLEPKKNYLVDGENEYQAFLNQTIADYPGAVIFTTFINSPSGKPTNEIYANGQLYSAGGESGSGAVYYGTEAVDSDGQIANFSAEPETGNVYIYDPEDNSSKTYGGNIADCTAYYYNGEKWIAFTGNVNAENVWFTNDFVLAGGYTQVGNLTKTLNGTGKLQATNKNLKTILETIFTKELYPTSIAGPTYTFSTAVTAPDIIVKKGTTTLSNNASLEVGTNIVLSKLEQNSSNSSEQIMVTGLQYGYKEGDTTNSSNTYLRTAIPTESGQYSLSLSTTGLVASTGISPTFTASTLENGSLYIPENNNLYISQGSNVLTVTEKGLTYTPQGFSETVIYPISNLGNTYQVNDSVYSISVSQSIGDPEAPSNTKTLTLTGYYPVFWGALSTKTESFTSSQLKALTHVVNKPTSISTPTNTIEIVVAIPYNGETMPTTFKSIVAGNGSGFTESSNMKTVDSVLVSFDGNISHKYKVLYAYAASSTANVNTYSITYNN